jgi:hypothetical protein
MTMRMLMKVIVDTAVGNKTIQDGTLPRVIQSTMERFQPEAAYFTAVDGLRTGYFVLDLADPAQIPVIAEPLFMELQAKVDFVPVMNAEDLQTGLQRAFAG